VAENIVARASVRIDAPTDVVWTALIDPDVVRQYMFGATVTTDWRTGSPISWTGEWNGQPFHDKGYVVRVEPGRRLEYSHYSPLSGRPDAPEHYHLVAIALDQEDGGTRVDLVQSNIATHEVQEHSEANWRNVLQALKDVVERDWEASARPLEETPER
jgi:uncharacterized protein YndB with AHSA1/START domain